MSGTSIFKYLVWDKSDISKKRKNELLNDLQENYLEKNKGFKKFLSIHQISDLFKSLYKN